MQPVETNPTQSIVQSNIPIIHGLIIILPVIIDIHCDKTCHFFAKSTSQDPLFFLVWPPNLMVSPVHSQNFHAKHLHFWIYWSHAPSPPDIPKAHWFWSAPHRSRLSWWHRLPPGQGFQPEQFFFLVISWEKPVSFFCGGNRDSCLVTKFSQFCWNTNPSLPLLDEFTQKSDGVAKFTVGHIFADLWMLSIFLHVCNIL